MDEQIARTIRHIDTLEALAQFESKARDALTDEIRQAIARRSTELGRELVAQRTGLDLSDLTPAEEKIVEAVSKYLGIMKRLGKPPAPRTLLQNSQSRITWRGRSLGCKIHPDAGISGSCGRRSSQPLLRTNHCRPLG
jgi:hypothetical protein